MKIDIANWNAKKQPSTARRYVASGLDGTLTQPPTPKRARTFQVGIDGVLSGVDIFVRASPGAHGTLQMEIPSVSATGAPVNDPTFL